MSIPGLDVSSRNFCFLHRLPNGRLVDLRLHYMPGDNVDEMTPRDAPYIPNAFRPVHIETFGQLMLLFVNEHYIDVFQRPAPQCDVCLTLEQKARIADALIT